MDTKKALKIARDAALAFYADEAKTDPNGYPYSPADATKAAAKKSGLPASRLVPVVAAVYYAENGRRSPLSFRAKNPTKATVAKAVRDARDSGGRLGRWEVVAVRLAVGLGKDPAAVSVAATKALYDAASSARVEGRSYSGRGTRAGATATRESETVEVVAEGGES